ncbi:MAG: serine/threonine protein kinase [Kiritimatiellia bacterium]
MSNRFEIKARIGKGATGQVYLANQKGSGGFSKLVALKILHPEHGDSDDKAKRLRDSARMLGMLRHRAIVHTDGLLQLDGRWTIIMEYVDGVDLSQALKLGPSPVGPMLDLIVEISDALHTAYSTLGPDGHALQVLHRDIGPTSIQLTKIGAVKLMDFDSAKATFDSREAKSTALQLGSAARCAPERLMGVEGPAADIYSLGVVAYEMITGAKFGNAGMVPAMHAQKLKRTMEIVARHDELEGNLVEIIESMLAYDPDKRPSAKQLTIWATDLRTYVYDPPLREWVADIMPAAMQAKKQLAPDELVGLTLGDREPTPGPVPSRTGARSLPPGSSADPSPSKRSWLPALLAGGGALVIVVSNTTAEPVADPVLVDASSQVPAEPAQPTAVLDALATVVEPAAKLANPTSTPKRTPKRAPKPTPIEVKPPTSAFGRVVVEGDAKSVELLDDGVPVKIPGEVKPGFYRIRAVFGEGSERIVGRVNVGAGDTITIKCSMRMKRCNPK